MDQVRSLVENFLIANATGKKPPLIIILGPTASGKTALSLEIAERFNGEIVSADSRQVYRYMDIGTDKIPMQERRGIPHHLIDVVTPMERFTLWNFREAAYRAIEDILSRGKVPFLVGGTGLYIESITKNYKLPPENPELRTELIKELAENGHEAMHKKLQTIDPASASKIHPRNTVYVIRAIEIAITMGAPKHDCTDGPRYEYLQIGLRWPMEILFERIHKRIDAQIEKGLVDETKRLLAMGYSHDLASMKSLGYKEMAGYLAGEHTLSEAVELLKKNTRNFAKRQITWFKRDGRIQWVEM